MKVLRCIISAVALGVVLTISGALGVNAAPIVTADGIRFDAEYYEATNPELASIYGSGFDAMYKHYLEHGRAEGRQPYAGAEIGINFVYNEDPLPQSSGLPQSVVNPNGKNIYVGDSRTYIMHNTIGDDGNTWIGYAGTKYDTFSTTAAKTIDSIPLAGKNIIILYGINDICTYGAKTTFDKYNYFLATRAQDWIKKGARVFFVNLYGVDNKLESFGLTINQINKEVNQFNIMTSAFPPNIGRLSINYGSHPLYDGIHFDAKTCRSVYNQINSYL